MDDLDAWLILNQSGLPARRQRRLVEAFGSAANILAADDGMLTAIEGISRDTVTRLRDTAATMDLARLRQEMRDHGVTLVPVTAPDYPPLLREVPDGPAALFVQGSLVRRDEMAVAIVGTRECTPYGLAAARKLAGDLARRGFTIVSGMARGIDAAAHQGALEAGGRTVAVMASGMDITYPADHADLRRRIADNGAVLTEHAFGVPPLREHFPNRNRIIAGLALGTVVVEAPAKSGAMITAGLAAEYGREVFAVPGSIDSPVSRGCHGLIKDGAKLVEVAEDVVAGLGILLAAVPTERPRSEVTLSGDEQAVLEALTYQPRHVDAVVADSGLAAAPVTAALMLLEMKGLIRRFPGNAYVRL
ncbi:MAG: DNA-protecting protein DprA [Armatimonadetes bacterium]|nr:DNA-protecting protein DprA [Armatimonadota bacterium]